MRSNTKLGPDHMGLDIELMRQILFLRYGFWTGPPVADPNFGAAGPGGVGQVSFLWKSEDGLSRQGTVSGFCPKTGARAGVVAAKWYFM